MSAADRQKWDQKYSDPANAPRDPSRVLLGLATHLPQRGSALELAGGAGRNALWLADRGLDVTIWDISTVGLAIARERAAAAGVTISTAVVDLAEPSFQPPGEFDLVLSVCYLNRPLLARAHQLLAPGGTLLVIQPTHQNLTRHPKPPRDYLLADGELPTLIQQLDIVRYEEGWLADDRHDAVLLAKKPA
jgi:SAM-dependent methyltransferase